MDHSEVADYVFMSVILFVLIIMGLATVSNYQTKTSIIEIEVEEDPALVKINQELSDIKCRISQLENTTEINLSLTTSIESMLQEKKNR